MANAATSIASDVFDRKDLLDGDIELPGEDQRRRGEET